MMQVGLKALLWPVMIALALLFGTGIFEIKKPEYACFSGKSISFQEKVPVLSVGSFNVNAYPLIHDCEPDDRYDPETTYKCAYQTYCQRGDISDE